MRDTRLNERLVVLVTADLKHDIAAAAANSERDEFQMSNMVRRAVEELMERERLVPNSSNTTAA